MIKNNIQRILESLPPGVKLVVAAKQRTAGEIMQAVSAGAGIIGQNYIREAKQVYRQIRIPLQWHFIGIPGRQKHDLLRRNVLEMFDMIETVDSMDIAAGIDLKCREMGKVMPILIEINSGRESQKSGVFPGKADELIENMARLSNVRIMGMMTMGPRFGNPEDSRPFFAATRKVFERIRMRDFPNVEMKYLSMGMTNSYRVALEEGANMVRIGSAVFGASAAGAS
ncbi:MAG: YggS family pyridoxal phosphate-dependent enzyme [Acidobacteriota bacterium]|jgi:pyridoxal phosphate enzyme (YggS family)|nr:YggS family pyridoxal phosphate-dependent enzyme [Acidobacteriota bacterium]